MKKEIYIKFYNVYTNEWYWQTYTSTYDHGSYYIELSKEHLVQSGALPMGNHWYKIKVQMHQHWSYLFIFRESYYGEAWIVFYY